MKMHVLHMTGGGSNHDQLVPLIQPNDQVEARIASFLPFGIILLDSSATDRERSKEAIADVRGISRDRLVWVAVDVHGRG